MSNELVVIEKQNVLTLFTEKDQLEEIIKQVEMEVATFEHDMSNQSRRGKTASLARKVASTKTYLDGLGKDLVADWKSKSKAVDANRKMMRDRLDALRDLARKPLTEWEEEDKRIKEEEAARIEAEKIAAEIERDHEMALLMDAEFNRKAEEARKAAEEAEKKRLEEEEKARIAREEELKRKAAEQARLEAERKAKEEADRLQREKEEAERKAEAQRQAAIQAELEAERAHEQAKRDAELAEQRRIEQEKEAKRQAELAEQRRIAEAKAAEEKRLADIEAAKQAEILRQQEEAARIKQEQEQREANKRHVGNIRKQAKESLMASAGLNEEQARAVVMAISKGLIANCQINY